MNESSPAPENNSNLENSEQKAENENESNEELSLKLNEMIKHMEFNIDQNRKKCDEASKDFYSLLKTTEVFAFDLLFASYLLGSTENSEIYNFFERCTNSNLDGRVLSDEHNDEIINHIQFLHEVIEKCANSLSTADIKQPLIPKRISEFIVFLKDQKIRLDHQIQRLDDANKVSETEEHEEEEECEDLSGLPVSFTKWLSSELKIGFNPDEESIEIRCLIKSITNRLQAISELSKSISNLQKNSLVINPDSCSQCPHDALINSPYLLGIKNSCTYLSNLLETLRTQRKIIKIFTKCLYDCKNKVDDLKSSVNYSFEEMTQQMNKLKEVSTKRKKEIIPIENNLRRYLDARSVQTIPQCSPQTIFQIIEASIKRFMTPLNDTQKRYFDAFPLNEIKKVRSEIAYLENEIMKTYKQILENDKYLFETTVKKFKIDEECCIEKEEMECLKQYEYDLNEVNKLLRTNDMNDWYSKFTMITNSFDQVANTQKEIMKELESQSGAYAENLKQQISSKTNEIQILSSKNYQINSEIGRSTLELNSVNEDLFRAKQELDVNNDFVPNSVRKYGEDSVKKHIRMVMCPICKTNRRNVILATCKHPICDECASKANHNCPICQKYFRNIDMKPFFIQ